jgi:hypothetical protein
VTLFYDECGQKVGKMCRYIVSVLSQNFKSLAILLFELEGGAPKGPTLITLTLVQQTAVTNRG